MWAQKHSFEPPAQPKDKRCALPWLCYSALLYVHNPPIRMSAGVRHSLFVDGEGRLASCGTAEGWTPGLLGHGGAVTQLNTPTLVPSTLGGERVT